MTTENIIFSQLLTNEEYARKVLPYLKEDYFSGQDEKNFLKIYSRFFKKHNKIPSKQAMLVEIENLKSSAEVYTSMVAIVNRTEEFKETLEWLTDATEKYCKDRAVFNALKESVLIVDGQDKAKRTPDAIPSILQEALAVCFDSSVGHDYFEDAQERFDYYHLTENRIPCGIPTFDKVTKGGFPRKTLNVFLAPPHGGKSMLMTNIAAGAIKNGFNVLYITMEMAAEEIGRRFDVNLMGIDFDTLELLSNDVFTSKFSKIAQGSVGRLVIKEYPPNGASSATFEALIGDLKTKQGFVADLIVVDYMGIMNSDAYSDVSKQNSYTIMGSIGKELRRLAVKYNAAVMTAVQTTRTGVGNSEIDMTHTSESFGIPAIADWFAAIVATDDLMSLGQIMFIMLKNRYKGLSFMKKFMMGVDYLKQTVFGLDNDTVIPDLKPPKTQGGKAINKKTDSSPVDMSHQIKSDTKTFEDFNFDS